MFKRWRFASGFLPHNSVSLTCKLRLVVIPPSQALPLGSREEHGGTGPCQPQKTTVQNRCEPDLIMGPEAGHRPLWASVSSSENCEPRPLQGFPKWVLSRTIPLLGNCQCCASPSISQTIGHASYLPFLCKVTIEGTSETSWEMSG